jgi:murein DD-endopeptidase MepM/ murein hydrolase activator NlpD
MDKTMSKITKYYKRLRVCFFRTAITAAFFYAFFMPSLVKIEEAGTNYFTIYLNESRIGSTDSKSKVYDLMAQARRMIAGDSTELVYARTDLEIEEEEVVFGAIDDDKTLLNRIAGVLQENSIQTLQHAYTVKVNNYSVNLASSEEVIELLDAALNKYDENDEYGVSLVLNSSRELNVLTAKVSPREEEEPESYPAFREGGVESYFEDIFDAIEPAGEKDFDDYDYGVQSMDFAESVEVVEAFLMEDEITPLEQAIEEVTKEEEVNVVYEVVSGDTLSGIAEKTNIPLERIIELNENIESETSTIRVGDELIVTVPEPELSVVRVEQQYLEETYDAEVIYIDNDSWYTNQEVTRQEPSTGFRNAVALVTYRNDEVVSKEVIKEQVLMEAVPKIIERGTKIPPTYIKPISGGRITSYFGRRTAPTKGASSYHKAIDWGTPVGTSVMASSGGTVTKAGWGSGYGYCVYIQHPDGTETRYAHLSKVLVSAGQTVKQGQKIALSGNTGVSTGPHLHFEIRINGVAVDPLNYLE